MPVRGLDHINIVTTDLAGTKQFYHDVLGLTDAQMPPLPPYIEAHWLADRQGRPIIHLQRHNPERHGADRASEPTGTIDHVALDCEDFAGMLARCEQLGVPCRVSNPVSNTFRQLFVTDPNNVVLELNFRT